MSFPSQFVLKAPGQLSFKPNNASICGPESENWWGPFPECRTILRRFLERWVLAQSGPAIILLAVALPRIPHLWKQNEKTRPNPMRIAKLVVAITLSLFQLALLVSRVSSMIRSAGLIAASIVPVILKLLVILVVPILSYLEERRSIQPSTILNVYLLLSFIVELLQAGTIYLQGFRYIHLSLTFTYVGLHIALLFLEAQNKRMYLKPEYQHLPPEAISGIISRTSFWWINELFSKGSRGLLTFEDLYDLDPILGGESVGNKMTKAWNERSKPEGRFSLAFATWRALRGQFAFALIPRLCLIALIFTQPFLITRVLELLEKPDNQQSRNEGYGLITATFLIYIGIGISSLHNNYALFRFTTMFRSGMVALIYEQTLILKDGTYDESAAMSLMSNDVDQISFVLEEMNEIWSRVLEIAMGLPLLTHQLGWVSVVPLIVVIIPFYGASVISKLIAGHQKLWGDATQKRLGITATMLRDMSSLKMMGLNEVVGDIVQNERVAETKRLESWGWIKVWQNVIANVPGVMAPAVTFGVYAIQAYTTGSESLNTVKVFTSLSLISLVSHPVTRLLASAPNTASSIGCFDRVQNFLLAEPRVDERLDSESALTKLGLKITNTESSLISEIDNGLAVIVDSANIRPARGADVLMSDVNLKIRRGTTVMITGPVGTGKTTLLKAILGEIACDSGAIYVQCRQTAYCSQSPWLQSGTIRAAIIGVVDETLVDETWYNTVIDACTLTFDLSSFRRGDQTLIGSRGITLSGGQKHRVALARALYARSEIFLLDDILSALDKRTEKIIADKLFGTSGLFHKLGATVIFVTHATRYLSLAHQVIVVPGPGQKVQQGKYKEIEQAGLIEDLPDDDTPSEEGLDADKIEEVDDTTPDITESNKVQDLQRQTGDITVYSYYFKSIGFAPIASFLLFVLLNEFANTFSLIWLKWWTDIHGTNIALYLSVYVLLGLGFVVGIGGYAWSCVILIGAATGRKLHRVLLNAVMKAPLSFFSQTETGSILSRFSQDMTLIEGQLATGLLVTFSNLLATVAAVGLLATGSPLILLTTPFLIIFVYFLQKTYLQTSRQLRYLDLEARSPLYSHFLETLEGLPTIRAFGWVENFAETNIRRLDDSQKPYYLTFCVARWLSFTLDMFTTAITVLVVGLAITFRSLSEPGLMGVSMNSLLGFTGSLSSFISGWTLLETSLGAVSRLRTFEKETPVEAKDGEDGEPPADWPSKGLIEVTNVSVHYKYAPLLPLHVILTNISGPSTAALQDINLTIQPGQKVGICGRTGSGKSTLLATLLRTLDLTTGSILIDGIDLSTLPRHLIRTQLTAVPQSALHLPGTLRQNLSPFSPSSNSDDLIISALESVQLWSILRNRGGLDAPLTPDSLSAGQNQLLSLARAILQKNKIVLLDEATSSVDAETDKVVKEVLGKAFEGCTVVTVAHRPETILGCEVVVLLEGGKVVEVGEPGVLMARESKLRALLGAGVMG